MLAADPMWSSAVTRTCENILESELYVACVERGGFDKGKVVLAWE